MVEVERGDQVRLRFALIATATVAIVECVGGFLAQSIALLTDSAHVFLDVVALSIALAAFHAASRPATRRQTFGFGRTEILAALLNGGLLLGITLVIVYEAVRRLVSPVAPAGTLMASFAAFGMVVNAAVGYSLLRASRHNINVRAAMLHVAGDALAAFGVVVAGLLIAAFGWNLLDPILSFVVAAVIVAGVVRIVREACDVLLESAPAHVNVENVENRIRRVEGVVGVHDLHVWTLGTGNYALSAHILLPDRSISDATQILQSVDRAMREEFAISHVTVQFECESCAMDERIVCTQMTSRGGTL
jgi:cobalt-zinc-cadmium efflux system protein